MSKGSSGKKRGDAAKKNRALYKIKGQREVNKLRKAKKQAKINEALLLKGKGPLVPKVEVSPVTL